MRRSERTLALAFQHEDAGTEHDGHIGDIENSTAQGADPNVHEIDYHSISDPIEKIGGTTSYKQSHSEMGVQFEPSRCTLFGKMVDERRSESGHLAGAVEEPFDFAVVGGRLSGTVLRPDRSEPVPAALLINGSGPLDRDSNIPGQTLDIARAIATHLSQHGIASLRYDKRGVAASPGDFLRTGFDEETLDAQHAIEALRGAPGIDRHKVCVIGHSVGATIAIRLAAAEKGPAAAVLLSGAARSGLQVMRQQSDRIAATLPWWRRPRRFLKMQDRDRQRLLESRDDVVPVQGQRLPGRWFREYMHYDPAPDLKRIACPVLAITGRADVQVDCEDVEAMRRAVRSEFTGHTPEHLTHLLRIDAGPPGLQTYPAQMRRPVDAGTLNVISAWLAVRGGPAASLTSD